MGTKFTKGDWIIDFPHSTPTQLAITTEIDNLQYNVCYVSRENEADAKLIEAAPKLYEALQEIMRFKSFFNWTAPELQYPDNFLKALQQAEAALKAASE